MTLRGNQEAEPINVSRTKEVRLMQVAVEPPAPEPFRWRFFAMSLSIRVFGAVLIWLGDGSPLLWRKAVVVLGVVLFLVGLTGLKYLLMAKPLQELGDWLRPKRKQEP
jgi:hypothetical protein